MRKIVINRCYGGFGVSRELLVKYRRYSGQDNISQYDIPRDSNVFIALLEEFMAKGWEYNDAFSDLKIVEIPDNVEWCIQDYDGMEWIAEKHETWS